jgi:multidrug efflux system membrane fusion protein
MKNAWFVGLVLAAACKPETPAQGPGGRPGAGARKFPVEVQVVKTEEVQYAIDAVGSLEAQEEVRVTARVAGVIEKISFEEGSAVTPETILADIDRARFQLLANRAAANHDKALAELEKAETFLQNRMALKEKDPTYVTREELANVTAQVSTAKANVAETKAALDLALHDQQNSQVRSLIAGTINSKNVSIGQYVTPGMLIATLVDQSTLKLRFKVSESESVKLRHVLQGTGRVSFSVRPIPGKSFDAKLVHISPQASAQTRTVECLALVENPDAGLKPGFFAVVRAVVETREKAVVVPDTAILPTDRGFMAFVVQEKDSKTTVVERKVVPGLFVREGAVEILSGLQEGDKLVVTGGAALKPGAEVQIGSGKKPEGRKEGNHGPR